MTDYFLDEGLTDRQVLGCAIDETAVDWFLRIYHRLSPEHFLKGPPRNLAIVVWDMLEAGEDLGLIRVAAEAKARGALESIGGGAALAEWGWMAPSTPEMLEQCVTDLEERYRAKRFGSICVDYGERSARESTDSLIHGITAETSELISDRAGELTTPAKRLPKTVEEMFSPSAPMLKTGYAGIDSMIGGLYPGRFYILGGRPSHGKTALAMGIADNACRSGKSVAVFSFEMTQDELLQRLISLHSGIDLQLIDTRQIPSHLADRVTTAAQEIHRHRLHIFAGRRAGLGTIIGTSRQIKQAQGLDLVIIDYLQLLTPERGQNREQEIAAISGGLKTAALELEVPIFALSQLKRPGDRGHLPPTMADLRESGAQEQDADVVCLIWRPNKDSQDPDNIGEIIVDKNRHGPTGRLRLGWNASDARFGRCAVART